MKLYEDRRRHPSEALKGNARMSCAACGFNSPFFENKCDHQCINPISEGLAAGCCCHSLGGRRRGGGAYVLEYCTVCQTREAKLTHGSAILTLAILTLFLNLNLNRIGPRTANSSGAKRPGQAISQIPITPIPFPASWHGRLATCTLPKNRTDMVLVKS